MKRALLPLLLAAACSEAPPAPTASPHTSGAPPGPAGEGAGAAVAQGALPAAPARPTPPADGPDLTLVFSASVAGELVPCGCSPDQRGGLPRAVGVVKALRASRRRVVVVDAGDRLFDGPTPPDAQLRSQKELKARALAKGAELMGAAAQVVGPRDLALGAGFLDEVHGAVPLLDAGAAPLGDAKATLVTEVDGVRIGLFAAGAGTAPEKTIAARAAEARAQGAQLVVVLLVPRGDSSWSAALRLLPAAREAGVDLAVLGRRDDPASDPDRKEPGAPPLLAVEGHGQSLLVVDVKLGKGPLQLAPDAGDRKAEVDALDARIARFRAQLKSDPSRKPQLEAKLRELEQRRKAVAEARPPALAPGVASASARFVALGKDAPEDDAAREVVTSYDRRVTRMNLEEARRQPESCPRPRPGERAFEGVSGENGCATCHADQAAFWQKTRHAHAYATLVKVEKQFSLDCIRCHVTGWQQPGGVCRIDRTARGGDGLEGAGVGRQDVQCEACHGPGSEHSAEPRRDNILRKIPTSTCIRCHEAANSPRFDDALYRPYIVGPGHGAPLASGQIPTPKPGSPLDSPSR